MIATRATITKIGQEIIIGTYYDLLNRCDRSINKTNYRGGLPYESHIAMCRPNRLGFWAFLT